MATQATEMSANSVGTEFDAAHANCCVSCCKPCRICLAPISQKCRTDHLFFRLQISSRSSVQCVKKVIHFALASAASDQMEMASQKTRRAMRVRRKTSGEQQRKTAAAGGEAR